jgi:hypothetical protein
VGTSKRHVFIEPDTLLVSSLVVQGEYLTSVPISINNNFQEEYNLLGCKTVKVRIRSEAFRRSVLPPSSGSNSQ